MQDPVVDKKIQVLFDNYQDNLYAKNAQQEVEAIRRKAAYTGAGITAAAFIGNEVARLTLRSRKYIIVTVFNANLSHLCFYSIIQAEGTKHCTCPLLAKLRRQAKL